MAQLGGLTDLVALRPRFADLVVLPRPYGAGQGAEAEAVVEAALFDGKAPVLMLPETGGLAAKTPGARGHRLEPKRARPWWRCAARCPS